MRIAFLSDIHGNLPALEAALEQLRRHGPCDAIIAGGDTIFRGAFDRACLELVHHQGWTAYLRGNAEESIFTMATEGRHPVLDDPPLWFLDQLRWSANQFDLTTLAELARLPLSWRTEGPSGQTLVCVHASPTSVWEQLHPTTPATTMERHLSASGADVLIYGHLHRPFVRQIAGRTVVNAGAVGEGTAAGHPEPSFVLAEDSGCGWKVHHISVKYDRAAYVTALARSGMPHAARIAALHRLPSTVHQQPTAQAAVSSLPILSSGFVSTRPDAVSAE